MYKELSKIRRKQTAQPPKKGGAGQKIWTDTSPKKIDGRTANKHMEDVDDNQWPENRLLQPPWDTIHTYEYG